MTDRFPNEMKDLVCKHVSQREDSAQDLANLRLVDHDWSRSATQELFRQWSVTMASCISVNKLHGFLTNFPHLADNIQALSMTLGEPDPQPNGSCWRIPVAMEDRQPIIYGNFELLRELFGCLNNVKSLKLYSERLNAPPGDFRWPDFLSLDDLNEEYGYRDFWMEMLACWTHPRLRELIVHDCRMVSFLDEVLAAAEDSPWGPWQSTLRQTVSDLKVLDVGHLDVQNPDHDTCSWEALAACVSPLQFLTITYRHFFYEHDLVDNIGQTPLCGVRTKHLEFMNFNQTADRLNQIISGTKDRLQSLTLRGLSMMVGGGWADVFNNLKTNCPHLIDLDLRGHLENENGRVFVRVRHLGMRGERIGYWEAARADDAWTATIDLEDYAACIELYRKIDENRRTQGLSAKFDDEIASVQRTLDEWTEDELEHRAYCLEHGLTVDNYWD